ncbi:phage tail protein [Lysobacter sp. D1-1-M9]|uniref:phage tail protein n=1 Tax=Novilysobacter longmucuonensis TaxID=3098603 RepID=UPI002FC8471E
MTEPFVGEIQAVGFNFAPKGWAQCNGALLSISQNTALFSLLGTTYGGNGTTTFGLPNLMGRAACNRGQGPGLAPRRQGEAFGESAVTLTSAQMPAHQHGLTLYAQPDPSRRSGAPAAGSAVSNPGNGAPFVASSPTTTFAPSLIGPAGGGQAHPNEQPYLGVNFCIALQGIYPSFD